MLQAAPDAQIVARMRGVTRENGRDAAQALLASGTAYDVVLSVNDAAAFGVIAVLQEQNIPPEAVTVFSVNGESLAQQYVRRGLYMQATIVFDRQMLARSTMEAVIKMLGGGSLPRTILVTDSHVVTADDLTSTP